MEIILRRWIRDLSLNPFPSELSLLIIKGFAYHRRMDSNCTFIDFGDDQCAWMKVLLIGSANVGKTALLERFIANQFIDEYASTIGVDFKTKEICIDHKGELLLQIWDTAGQERFRSLSTPFYRGSHIVIFVYDITNRKSLMDIKEKWSLHFDQYAGIIDPRSIPRILVGTKCDLQKDKECSGEDVLKVVKECGIWTVFECSAKETMGVDALFSHLIPDLLVDVKH